MAAVLLAACQPTAASETPPTSPTAASVADPNVMPTEDPNLPQMECVVVSLVPTPGPTEVSLFPHPDEDDHVKGSDDALLTIMEYSDFQCPYCSQLSADLKTFYEENPEDVRVVFRHFPIQGHNLALAGAYATEAAALQGKFWEMEDRLFSQQAAWAAMTADEFNAWLVEQAADIGLDTDKFAEDMKDEQIIAKVAAAQQNGMDIGIPGTPFILLNGQPYQGPRDLASLESILNLFRLQDRQYTYCPPMQIDPQKQYIASMQTEKGEIQVQLFADKAPMAVNSFVFLARNGWFDDTTFHRVMPGFVAQGGDPSASGFGGPGYSFDNEVSDLKFNKAGMLGMANSGPGTNGSQFFITYGPLPDLDSGYTVFGEVIAGMDVVESLSPRDTQQDPTLPPGDTIQSVTIEEK
jgi:cyclophilin family peptidyl-prolyl cis-trans isomerase/protein-disulfide isomerase